MNRLHLLIVSLFAVALGTGIVVGMGVTRPPAPHDGRSWLTDQLGLSEDQSTKMRQIWEDLRGTSKARDDSRIQFRKERDDSLQALLTPEQKIQYAQIVEHFNAQRASLDRDQAVAFQAAAERTKTILSDKQRTIYDELLKRGFRGGPGGPGGRPGGGPPGTRGDHGHGLGHGPDRGGPDHGGPGHGPDPLGGGNLNEGPSSQPG